MFKEAIGTRSTVIKNTVERGAVKKFAVAINDLAPIYYDEEAGKNSRYQRNIAPPTFPVTLDFGTIPNLNLPAKGLIHGEQIFHYERPIFVGEEVYCYTEVKDYYEKTGSNGRMGFLVIRREGLDIDQNLIFSEDRILIINEAVRKGMGF
ncbi:MULTISPECIES: MaoC family dehydratase N-terminal domain-containing protein [Solibacillus]|uniref:MaoC family dehydratase N-terminal domain-containing protein n=1 Tax=Solibacillus merdavium TaxID=2762218 RepID=A0ABR8XMD1_9BACL|nr:MaoC family dehydratase N-terminal domain-containing protein [Solibacillus merdavium]MBD8033096.1 MaoC family dehydratase N-terminal domain-containing protein [Solibacillus merdavium]